ncbi:hypothetical protein KC359_g23 [Hortaea werneckii]|nr:hypothetical protein KC359_g23 [Hortaea werneckii]
MTHITSRLMPCFLELNCWRLQRLEAGPPSAIESTSDEASVPTSLGIRSSLTNLASTSRTGVSDIAEPLSTNLAGFDWHLNSSEIRADATH